MRWFVAFALLVVACLSGCTIKIEQPESTFKYQVIPNYRSFGAIGIFNKETGELTLHSPQSNKMAIFSPDGVVRKDSVVLNFNANQPEDEADDYNLPDDFFIKELKSISQSAETTKNDNQSLIGRLVGLPLLFIALLPFGVLLFFRFKPQIVAIFKRTPPNP